jgi:transcription elongation GreA/GreB family factor
MCSLRCSSSNPPARTSDALSGIDPASVALEVLTALASLVRAGGLDEEQRREHIAELRGALFVRGGEPLRMVLGRAEPQQLSTTKAVGERNPALTDRMRSDLMGMIRALDPSLFARAVPPWQEGVVYTTEAGIERRRAELERIVHVRLPEVMREIGQAAAFGDVTDNAEYRSAVQERARLAEWSARIQKEIAGARVITAEMASADHVTVGSRVEARNLATGQVETFVFLGPWDAHPADGVYAYNAPLGLAFMGRRVGETVAFGTGEEERRWEVLSVGPGV